jgi:hypothetical protein
MRLWITILSFKKSNYAILGINQGQREKGDSMKSKNALLAASILFAVFAVSFAIVIWGNVSLAAKIAFFACGFGSGVFAGRYSAK